MNIMATKVKTNMTQSPENRRQLLLVLNIHSVEDQKSLNPLAHDIGKKKYQMKDVILVF